MKIFIFAIIKKYYIVFLLVALVSILSQSIYNPLFVFHEINYLFQPYDLRGYAKGIIYICAYITSIAGIVLVLGINSSILFAITLSFIFIFYSVDFFIQIIGSTPGFSIEKYALMLSELGSYEYLLAYLDDVGYSILLALLIVLCLIYIRKIFYKNKYNSKFLLLLTIPFVSVYYASDKVSSIEWSSFPSFTKTPIIIIRYNTNHVLKFKERVLDSNIKVEKKDTIKNIIWVIDESITGSYLSINGYDKETTPYLSSLLETANIMTNYGIVNSVSNCSSPSNFYLRLGMNPRLNLDIKQASLNLPTIYQYAKRAGYETWLYDSQAAKDTLQNNLSIYDVKDIDHFHTLDRTVLQRDKDAIFVDEVGNILDDDSNKKFIVLVKFGAHFPYLLSYDNANTFFTPVMNVTYGGNTLENKDKLINTYLNSIRNNTDLYIKNLLTKLDLSNTVVFYTSDHGQNIMETESNSPTHCNYDNIVKNEATVPLFVFHKNANKIFPVNQEKNYSQIQMFPTTLSLMGYSEKIIDRYGVTLWDGLPKKEKRKFFITYSEKISVYD